MKTKILTSVVAAALLAGGASAQNSAPASASPGTIVTPSSPAPAVAPATAAPAPNQFVYTPRLPSAAELTNAAAAQGLSVERIEQSATQIVATYKNSSGQTNIVSYQTLPPTAGATTPMPTTPPPAVVYEQRAPRVVYYDNYDPYYYPYYSRAWYPPVSLQLGFGYGFGGGYRGSYRGGFRGSFHHGR